MGREVGTFDGVYIWIDALCIKQIDTEEKGMQVA